MRIERHLILSQSEWGDLFSRKKVNVSAYLSIFIGLFLLYINDGPSALGEKGFFLFIYTYVILFTLITLALGIFLQKYLIIPISIIIFNFSYVIVNFIQTFHLGQQILEITVCQSVIYFLINAIVFRLFAVFLLNLSVFLTVFMCGWHSLLQAGPSAQSVQPFMVNAIVLSGACLLLLHLVLTIRGVLIEQLGSIKLQMAALEAEMEIENARQEARDKAVLLNRISVIEALGASIAHEINQPIAAALTYSQAARNWAAIECQSAPETLQAVAGVATNVDRAARLIHNIRLLTTKKERVYALADVFDIVSDQVNLVRNEFGRRGIKILLQRPESEIVAVVCAPEIALAIINLLRNAMEAFDESDEDSMVAVECREAGSGWVEVLVTDNGRGLGSDAPLATAGAFQSRKENGFGIGLSICQEVAEHHSGSISLIPNAERGTIAILRLAARPNGT